MRDGGDQLREHVLGHTAAVLPGVVSYYLAVLGAELAIHHALACCPWKLTQVHTGVPVKKKADLQGEMMQE